MITGWPALCGRVISLFGGVKLIVKISDIADAQGGIVLSRKESKNPGPNSHKYKRLTLRAMNESGFVMNSELEDFYATEPLDSALFTQPGTVAVRLAYPLFPVFVEEENSGLLVPSQIAILKVKQPDVILPEYLRLYLAQKDILERIQQIESGTAQRTVKIGTILDLQIFIPDMETQRKAAAIDQLSRKREQMYRSLIAQERIVTDHIIESIIGGVTV